jgi:hypothetical protein
VQIHRLTVEITAGLSSVRTTYQIVYFVIDVQLINVDTLNFDVSGRNHRREVPRHKGVTSFMFSR